MSVEQPRLHAKVGEDTPAQLKEIQTVFNDDDVEDDTPKSIFADILKQIATDNDLTRVSMPAFITDPKSFLETIVNLFTHMDVLREALSMTDPIDRMTHLTRFYLSGFHVRPRGVKKPYDPVQGEVFRCYWDHDDGSRTWYIGEQVQKRPPVSAFYFENLDLGFTAEGHIEIQGNFTGNSAGTFLVGTIYFNLLKYKETYTITYPVYYARGVVVGKMRMEVVGKTRITCEQTKLASHIRFLAKPMFGGKYNQCRARIYYIPNNAERKLPTTSTLPEHQQIGRVKKNPIATITGDWTSDFSVTDHRRPVRLTRPSPQTLPPKATPTAPKQLTADSTFPLFDVTRSHIQSKKTVCVDHQAPYESRQVWKELTTVMGERDYTRARDVKFDIEAEHTKQRQERKEAKVGFRQRFFHWDPVPATPEEQMYTPQGRWKFNEAISNASPDAAKDPATRAITCYNVPDMHAVIPAAPPLTPDLIKKDHDAKATDFLHWREALAALEKQGLPAALGEKWPMGPCPLDAARSTAPPPVDGTSTSSTPPTTSAAPAPAVEQAQKVEP